MVKRLAMALAWFLVSSLPGAAQEEKYTLLVPPALVESGFTQHLLPRFRFRHKIPLVAVTDGATSDLRIVPDTTEGRKVLTDRDGTHYSLIAASAPEVGAKFLDWLQSDAGRNAVAGFPKGGPPMFTPYEAPVVEAVRELPTGDVEEGAKLALVHCGRCHVVDDRNRMGGIGSTPSFGAMRARENWDVLFTVFWTEPPHPSFTQVEGLTDAFTPSRPSHIEPVVLHPDEVEAIVAFIATIPPKDLGAPIGGGFVGAN